MSDTIFITEPNVYLVASTYIDRYVAETFLSDIATEWTLDDDVTDADNLVEFAGRICYMSFDNPRPGGNEAYVKHILEVGHGSVLEHASFSLLFTGVSRSLTHETIRHRAGFGYSQLSQRYVDESDCAFVVPPLVNRIVQDSPRADAWWMWMQAMGKAKEAYGELSDELYQFLCVEAWKTADSPRDPNSPDMDWGDEDHAMVWIKSQPTELRTAIRKQAREAARSVLPNATETKIVVTGNARSWRHWLHMRGSAAADAEIRRLAGHVLPILKECAPNIFMDCTIDAQGVVTVQHQA